MSLGGDAGADRFDFYGLAGEQLDMITSEILILLKTKLVFTSVQVPSLEMSV
jgi:hypothetical protein